MLMRSTLMGLLVLAAGALARPQVASRGPGRFGPGPGPGPFGGARFLGAEAGMPGRVVKNAPFSADVVTETTQTLPDGNRIHQITTVKMYRDSEGRTRREQSLKNLNGLAPNANLPPVVFINGFQFDGCPVTFADTFGVADQVLQSNGEVSLFFSTCSLPPDATIEDLGNAFATFLAGLQYTDGSAVEQVDVVAHSMGGLVVKQVFSYSNEKLTLLRH